MCSSLLLAVGIYTSHLLTESPFKINERLNERNDLVAVQCDSVIAGHFVNSQGLDTAFASYDIGYGLDEVVRVGVLPSFVWGYEEEVLSKPFAAFAYFKVGMFQLNWNPEVTQVSVVFDLGE